MRPALARAFGFGATDEICGMRFEKPDGVEFDTPVMVRPGFDMVTMTPTKRVRRRGRLGTSEPSVARDEP